MKFLENPKIQIIIVFIIFFIVILKANINEDKYSFYKKQGWSTIGIVVDHRTSGLYESFYVEYMYSVNKQNYINVENYGGKFKSCFRDKECIGRKFVVYYNKNNPEEAYMDFNDEK